MKTNSKKFTALFTIILFFIVAIFGIFSFSGMEHHHNVAGCPFMVGENSLCPMGLLEHITAWKTLLSTYTSYIFILAISLVCFLLSRHLGNSIFLYYLRYIKKSFLKKSLLQELFSQGILNPKAP